MNYKMGITIFQVIMLLLALVISIFWWAMSGLVGLGGPNAKLPINYNYYVYLSLFIVLGFILKLIFRRNTIILSITGIFASITLAIFALIIFQQTKIISMNDLDLIYYGTIVLTLISALWGLFIK